MLIDYTLLGERIAKARKERNISQARLSEKADMSNNYLSNVENSRSIPSLETLVKLCAALDVTPNDLLLGVSTQSKDYAGSDIFESLSQCTAQEKRYIKGFIKVLIAERLRS
jgi:transcriptional regulator with XRE-family HTH domain